MLNLTSDGTGWRNESILDLITLAGNQNISYQTINSSFTWYGQNLSQNKILGVM